MRTQEQRDIDAIRNLVWCKSHPDSFLKHLWQSATMSKVGFISECDYSCLISEELATELDGPDEICPACQEVRNAKIGRETVGA